MGVQIAERQQHFDISVHTFRASRRRAAIDKKEQLLASLNLQCSKLQHEVDSWWTWWSSASHSAKSENAYYYPVDLVAITADAAGEAQSCRNMSTQTANPKAVKPPLEAVPSRGGVDANPHCDYTKPESLQRSAPVFRFSQAELDMLLEKSAEQASEQVAVALQNKIEARMTDLSQKLADALADNAFLKTQLSDLQGQWSDARAHVEQSEHLLDCGKYDSDICQDDLDESSSYGDRHSFVDQAVPTASQGGEPVSVLPYRRELGDCRGLCKNELRLPVDVNDVVQWDRCRELQDTFGDSFQEAHRSGCFVCRSCKTDVTRKAGAYGMVYCTDDLMYWEQKHVWSLVDDPPAALLCFACHYRSIPCKFHLRGSCVRGALCAYRHDGEDGDEDGRKPKPLRGHLRRVSHSTNSPPCPCFLDAKDLLNLRNASTSHMSYFEIDNSSN